MKRVLLLLLLCFCSVACASAQIDFSSAPSSKRSKATVRKAKPRRRVKPKSKARPQPAKPLEGKEQAQPAMGIPPQRVPQTRVAFEWVQIPGGEFTMGSEDGNRNELPTHPVRVDGFLMSRHEVTFAQYDAFCAATGRGKPRDEGWGRGQHPVINVTYHDAKAFCEWACVSLPSEAQWEYACRAGTKGSYSCGQHLSTLYAHFGRETTALVGQRKPNAYGLHDMHGNVEEWCEDGFAPYSFAFSHNPRYTTSEENKRVVRGGAYHSMPYSCESSTRDGVAEHDAKSWRGFRVVKNL